MRHTESRLGFAGEKPVEAGVVHRQRECRGHANEGMRIAATGLQQQHAVAVIIGENCSNLEQTTRNESEYN